MTPTQPNPVPGLLGLVMNVQVFLDKASKGIFIPDDVRAYWATDTHYDPELSVWGSSQPPEATKVVLFAIPLASGLNEP